MFIAVRLLLFLLLGIANHGEESKKDHQAFTPLLTQIVSNKITFIKKDIFKIYNFHVITFLFAYRQRYHFLHYWLCR